MSIEEALARLEAEVVEAERASDAFRAALKKVRKAVAVGDVAAFEKALPLVSQRLAEASAVASGLADRWEFDARSYMKSGYASELREAAGEAGLHILEKDGKLYAFPLIIGLLPSEAAVKVGRKKQREIRPSELVRKLVAFRKKPQRLNDAAFLDLLYRAYQRFVGAEWTRLGNGPGPVAALGDIHALLTLLPGSDYALEEFGRDLFLLDRNPDLRTKDGSSFAFASSTLTKEKVARLSVYDEAGREHVYVAIRFVKG